MARLTQNSGHSPQALAPQALGLGDALGQHRSAVHAADQQASRRCRIGNLPAMLFDPTDHRGSTLRRHASILVQVHPESLPIMRVGAATHSLTGLSRVNNLHSFDT
jgi:hypothetical protein